MRALLDGLTRDRRGVFAAFRLALRLGWKNPRHLPLHLFYWVESLLVSQWIRKQRIRHLHVHFATQVATVGLITAKGFGIPFSLTVHGPDEFDDTVHFHLAEKLEAARFVVCIGHFCKSQLLKLCAPAHWPKFQVVPLGVDPAEFVPAAAVPMRLAFEVICVGRLVPQKGQAILVEAVARLAATHPGIHLRLVGDGPDRKALENQVDRLGIREKVTFEGSVNRDRIAGLLSNASLFVLASFAEGIPVALMEAMAREIPVISTYIAGIPELIRPEVDGLLVPPSDVDALAAAIARLADEPDLRSRLGRAGRQRVLERYDLGVNLDRLADVFRNRLASPGGEPLEC